LEYHFPRLPEWNLVQYHALLDATCGPLWTNSYRRHLSQLYVPSLIAPALPLRLEYNYIEPVYLNSGARGSVVG
jgi:hypothetical protein